MSKVLVAYFSCSGLTKQLSKNIAEVVEGDLFEIMPEIPYTNEDLDWLNEKSRSTLEMKNLDYRPKIKLKVNNINDYNSVFVGFPIWWHIAPTIIQTFLESYDFSGKTVIPFCTSGGSQTGKTDEILQQSCSTSTIWQPTRLLSANASKQIIEQWLNDMHL